MNNSLRNEILLEILDRIYEENSLIRKDILYRKYIAEIC